MLYNNYIIPLLLWSKTPVIETTPTFHCMHGSGRKDYHFFLKIDQKLLEKELFD